MIDSADAGGGAPVRRHADHTVHSSQTQRALRYVTMAASTCRKRAVPDGHFRAAVPRTHRPSRICNAPGALAQRGASTTYRSSIV